MTPHLPSFDPTMTFDQAAKVVLEHLREHVPMGLWSVTRVENERQTHLYLDDNDYGLVKGDSVPWADSFCVHLAAGQAPSVAPVVSRVPAYANAPVNALVQVGSYAGSVVREPDGRVFGVVCGISKDSREHDPRLLAAGPLLQLLGMLLSMVLAADRAREQAATAALVADLAAETDVLTGLANRRAWERRIAEEEARFARLADPTVVAISDLDFLKTVNDTYGHAAGDDYIRRAADALVGSVRPTDTVARLGGDEFGLLLRGCDEAEAEGRVQQVYAALDAAGVASSVGWAPITVVRGFPAALAAADQAMYAAKASRRQVRVTS